MHTIKHFQSWQGGLKSFIFSRLGDKVILIGDVNGMQV